MNRMKKIGIEITFIGNVPWIYFDKINGNSVKEKFYSDHGFVVFLGETIPNIEKTFEIIRKYR